MLRAQLLLKNYPIKLLKKIWRMFLVMCRLFDLIHFPFNLRHTKTIKILMCVNEQKPELKPEPEP